MNTVKCAVIGLGAIHMNHIRAIRKLENVRLCAVCDIDQPLLLRKQEEFGCAGYTDFKEMLQKEKPDVVHILTPHYLHAPMAIYCMEAGADVLVEKPMGMNSRETAEVTSAAERTGRRLGVCFQNRYNPTSRRIRELLDSGEAGELISAKMTVTWDRDEAYYGQAAWRGTWDQEGGGVLINQAIHTLDLMQWYTGFPVDVQAQTSCFRLGGAIEVEDTAHGYFHYANGATGIFYATNAFGANSPIEIELVLEHAHVHLRKDLHIEYEDGREESVSDTTVAAGAKGYWGDGHESLIRDYYDKRSQGLPFPIDGREASKAIRIIECIYRSAATGNRISLS